MKRMTSIVHGVSLSAVAVAMFAGSPVFAVNGNIVLQFGSDCDVQLPFNCRTRMHVYGQLFSTSASGITGAEYSIRANNPNAFNHYLFTESFPAGAIVLGGGALLQPPQVNGVNIAFAECQTGNSESLVLLETVDIWRFGGSAPGVTLEVVKHDRPSNQFFQCPLFTLCDAPVYTKVCVGFNLTTCPNPEPPFPNNATCSSGASAFINGPECCLGCEPAQVDCTVAVESTMWSKVKSLYRN